MCVELSGDTIPKSVGRGNLYPKDLANPFTLTVHIFFV